MLFDFGTARSLADIRPAEITGTNPYIAPEECHLRDTGIPADVFSLGVTIYEMLTGELPFGKDSSSEPFPQISRSAIALSNFRKGIPEEIENVIFACLERNPDFRPALPEILPVLNRFITRGPAMWPDGFDPKTGKLGQSKRRTARGPSRRSLDNCGPERLPSFREAGQGDLQQLGRERATACSGGRVHPLDAFQLGVTSRIGCSPDSGRD